MPRRILHTLISWLVATVCSGACGPPAGGAGSVAGLPGKEIAAATLRRPALGVGTNYAETKSFRRCVTTPLTTTSHAFASRVYHERQVASRSELNEALNIDAAASAKGLWGEAGGAASFFKNVKMTSEAFYWLVHADYQLVDQAIDTGSDNFQLTDVAKKILLGPDPINNFHRACGDFFYSGVRLGARYALLYEIKSAESSAIEHIKASAAYSAVGADAKASLDEITSLAQRASALTIHSAVEGGSIDLSSFASSPGELEAQLSKLREDLYERRQGVATEFSLGDYSVFVEVQEAQRRAAAELADTASHVILREYDEVLRRLYTRLARNIDVDQRIEVAFKRAEGDDPLAAYGQAKRRKLRAMQMAIAAQNRCLGMQARLCLENQEQCELRDDLVSDPWEEVEMGPLLSPDEDFTHLQGWAIVLRKRPGSKHRVFFVGRPPAAGTAGREVVFETQSSVMLSPLGVIVDAERGHEYAKIVGTSSLVSDPVGGQPRVNICVYESGRDCALRVVPLGGEPGSGMRKVKLQIVFFDAAGFVTERRDYPPLEEMEN